MDHNGQVAEEGIAAGSRGCVEIEIADQKGTPVSIPDGFSKAAMGRGVCTYLTEKAPLVVILPCFPERSPT